MIEILAIDDDRTLGTFFLQQDQLEEGGFAGAGMAQHKNELAVVDVEVDVLQRDVLVVLRFIYLCYMYKVDHV